LTSLTAIVSFSSVPFSVIESPTPAPAFFGADDALAADVPSAVLVTVGVLQAASTAIRAAAASARVVCMWASWRQTWRVISPE
jgi:hypothetical protein